MLQIGKYGVCDCIKLLICECNGIEKPKIFISRVKFSLWKLHTNNSMKINGGVAYSQTISNTESF